MATFALIHGAGDVGWYWHLVEAELCGRGHDVLAVDLPCDDDTAGLAEYTDTVVEVVGDRRNINCGHTPALSRPKELADRLEAYALG